MIRSIEGTLVRTAQAFVTGDMGEEKHEHTFAPEIYVPEKYSRSLLIYGAFNANMVRIPYWRESDVNAHDPRCC